MTELTEQQLRRATTLTDHRGRLVKRTYDEADVIEWLAAARAEGARDMRTKIETLLMATANHHERVFQHPGGPTRTCGVCSLPWPCQTYTARRALLADGGEPQ